MSFCQVVLNCTGRLTVSMLLRIATALKTPTSARAEPAYTIKWRPVAQRLVAQIDSMEYHSNNDDDDGNSKSNPGLQRTAYESCWRADVME